MTVASEATGNVTSRVGAMLDAARERLVRLSAAEIPAALARGAVLVDIRPAAQAPTASNASMIVTCFSEPSESLAMPGRIDPA